MVLEAEGAHPKNTIATKERAAYSPEYFQKLMHRHDIAAILSDTPDQAGATARPSVLTTGTTPTDYLVLQHNGIRYLFDLPEDPAKQVEPSPFTLVVEKSVMQEQGLLPTPDEEGFHHFQSLGEAAHFTQSIEQHGYFAGRFTGAAVEENPDFLQPVPCIIALDQPLHASDSPRILFSRRSIRPSQDSDARLNGKLISPLVMGHIEPADYQEDGSALINTARREIAEEAVVSGVVPLVVDTNNQVVTPPLRFRDLYQLSPLGTVFLPNGSTIDKVHIGFVIVAQPKTDSLQLTTHPDGREAVQPMWLSPEDYAGMLANGEQSATWNDPIAKAIYHRRRSLPDGR